MYVRYYQHHYFKLFNDHFIEQMTTKNSEDNKYMKEYLVLSIDYITAVIFVPPVTPAYDTIYSRYPIGYLLMLLSNDAYIIEYIAYITDLK